jgi:myosin V
MQQSFVMQTFKREVALYESEGLDKAQYPDVSFVDNVEVLDMLEHKSHGIMALLEEASNWTKSTDSTLLAKMNTTFKKSDLFQQGLRQRASTSFVIRHTAAQIMYEIDGFVVSNRNRGLTQEMLTVLSQSTMPLMNR